MFFSQTVSVAIMERCAWIDVVLTVLMTSVTKQGFVREGVSKDGLDTFVRVCHLKRNMYLLLISLTHQFFFTRFRKKISNFQNHIYVKF